MGGSRHAWTVLAMLLLGCRGPTPDPTPLQREGEKEPTADALPVVPVPKFDVAPPGPKSRPQARQPPDGFSRLDPGIRLDIRYATPNNFTGAALPGYLPRVAWLRTGAAKALAQVNADLKDAGLGLLVFDAYRPMRATAAMVAWAKATKKTALLSDGYVSPVSNHNRGDTVDLTLVSLEDGSELDMGTAWDTFSEASHYAAASGEAMANRKRLRQAMKRRGFVPYDKEWWHFRLKASDEPPRIDVAYDE
ncbi:MAG: M15 family metallopeptidase [Myxococcota bacterium]